ncbi:MAG TPA: UvrD-helicase domain-containing protein [Hanamia sp.]|nr:UvrD-helicase domain-containing protein [Hanamia sp.]
MQLTAEQQNIIQSTGNIKINAVAGSGKTTTIIEYAKTRPASARILYLAFNKSVKLEATKKFAEKGLQNVKVETAHSLAFKHVVFKHNYKVKPQGYKTNEIAEILNLQATGEKYVQYIIANHINKFVAYFCNSDTQRVQDLNYLETITDAKASSFVKTFYNYIENQTRLLLKKMDKGEIEIIHDFYLKKFQLSNPVLGFDYILFDEGQDASSAMLHIFLKQKCTKVIVGDTHQQIYGWRYAVNSLEKVDFKTLYLSTSFRFAQPIANLAMEILKFKNHISGEPVKDVPIKGQGAVLKESKTKAVLARTNLGLLLKAIEYVTEKKKVKHIYFEGNINSYTYADEGASLYDVLNLYNGRHFQIKDVMIKSMKDLRELQDYIDKTEDVQLRMMVEVVKEYGNKIPGIIKSIKDKHVLNDKKEKAEMIFSTVHRCKGMEYDSVQIVNDFITEEKLEKLTDNKKKEKINKDKLNEEINLLYVAVTRAKNSLYIPETLMPKEFPPSSQIHIIKVVQEEETAKVQSAFDMNHVYLEQAMITGKTNSFQQIRQTHKSAYLPWTDELDEELTTMYCEGVNIRDMMKHFGRTRGAINSRIKKLELEELYG